MPDPNPKLIRREEIRTSKEFFSRLKQPDVITVKAIVGTVKSLAEGLKSELDEFDGQNPFFAIYGIGGNITKSGDRPDVDLLVVTNAMWLNGYESNDDSISHKDSVALGGDWVAGTLRDVFEKESYKVTVKKKIPNRYSQVGINLKGMLRLNPNNEGRKPIDIVIVNHTSLKNKEIQTLEEFEELGDVNKHGQPLPKVLLFKTQINYGDTT